MRDRRQCCRWYSFWTQRVQCLQPCVFRQCGHARWQRSQVKECSRKRYEGCNSNFSVKPLKSFSSKHWSRTEKWELQSPIIKRGAESSKDKISLDNLLSISFLSLEWRYRETKIHGPFRVESLAIAKNLCSAISVALSGLLKNNGACDKSQPSREKPIGLLLQCGSCIARTCAKQVEFSTSLTRANLSWNAGTFHETKFNRIGFCGRGDSSSFSF